MSRGVLRMVSNIVTVKECFDAVQDSTVCLMSCMMRDCWQLVRWKRDWACHQRMQSALQLAGVLAQAEQLQQGLPVLGSRKPLTKEGTSAGCAQL